MVEHAGVAVNDSKVGYAFALGRVYGNQDPTVWNVPTMHKANCCFKPRKHFCLNSSSSWLESNS